MIPQDWSFYGQRWDKGKLGRCSDNIFRGTIWVSNLRRLRGARVPELGTVPSRAQHMGSQGRALSSGGNSGSVSLLIRRADGADIPFWAHRAVGESFWQAACLAGWLSCLEQLPTSWDYLLVSTFLTSNPFLLPPANFYQVQKEVRPPAQELEAARKLTEEKNWELSNPPGTCDYLWWIQQKKHLSGWRFRWEFSHLKNYLQREDSIISLQLLASFKKFSSLMQQAFIEQSTMPGSLRNSELNPGCPQGFPHHL